MHRRLWVTLVLALSPWTGAGLAEIYHEARPVKETPPLAQAPLLNLNDDDIVEQIEVYSADDESSSLNAPYDDDSPGATILHVVTRSEIETSGARNLLDILKNIASLDVTREINGYHQVSARGLRGDARLKLNVDGREAQNPYSGRNYWLIPADLIERVEVKEGPSTLENGPGALSSVVNVVTRQKIGVAARFYAGNFATIGASAALGAQTPSTRSHLSFQFENTEGPQLVIEGDKYSSRSIGRGREELLTNAQRLSGAVAASTDITLSKSANIHLLANAQAFFEDRGGYIGALDTSGPQSNLSWNLWKADLSLRVPYGRHHEFAASIYSGQNFTTTLFQLTPSRFVFEGKEGEDSQIFTDGVLSRQAYRTMLLGALLSNKLQLFAGNQLHTKASIEVNGILRGSFAFEMNRTLDGNLQALGSLDGIDLRQNLPCNLLGFKSSIYSACRMTLNAAILDEWQIERRIKLIAGLGIFGFSDVEFELSSFLVPKVGVVILPTQDWVIKIFFQSGIRAPTFEEQYDQTSKALVNISSGLFVGSEILKSELNQSVEADIVYRRYYGGVKYEADLSGYVSSVSNVIEKVDIKGDVNTLSNATGYHTVGAQGGLRSSFRDGSSAFLNIAWFRSYWRELDALGFDACPSTGCSIITNLPQLRANLGVNWNLGKVGSLFVNTQLGSERRNNVRSDLERQRQYRIAPYALLNLSFETKPLFGHIVLQGSVFNLLNFKVKDDVMRPDYLPGMVPREGVSFYFGISIVKD